MKKEVVSLELAHALMDINILIEDSDFVYKAIERNQYIVVHRGEKKGNIKPIPAPTFMELIEKLPCVLPGSRACLTIEKGKGYWSLRYINNNIEADNSLTNATAKMVVWASKEGIIK